MEQKFCMDSVSMEDEIRKQSDKTRDTGNMYIAGVNWKTHRNEIKTISQNNMR